MPSSRSTPALLLAAAAYLAACGNSTTGSGDLLVVASVVVDPPGATLAAGQTLQFRAEPRTSSGVHVPGRPVTWTSSDPDIATVGETTGLVSAVGPGGPVALTARVDGVSESVPVTVGAGPGTALKLVTQPSSTATSGVAFASQPVVQVIDSHGNAVALSGVGVLATILSGSPSLSGTTSITTDASGKAVFTDLVITGEEGERTLIFAASGMVSTTSNPIAVRAANAYTLSITTQPSSSAQSGVPFATQPVVRVLTTGGSNVGGAAVTASLASGPQGATLGGTLTVTSAGNGRATFTNLSITGPVGTYALQFTTAQADPVTSTPIVLGAGPAAQLVITTEPGTQAVSGQLLDPQPIVEIRDGYGNLVTTATTEVKATLIQTGAVSGTLSGGPAKAEGGVARFTDLAITSLLGTFRLRFEVDGLAPATSVEIQVSPF